MGRVILMALMILAACKSTKKTATGSYSPPRNLTEFQSQALRSRNMPEYLSMKAASDYKDGSQSYKLNINLRMKRDEIIWASVAVPTLGLEVARLLADRDTVRIISYFTNEFVVKPLSYMEKYTGTAVSIGQLQDLLLAQPFISPSAGSHYSFQGNEIKIEHSNANIRATEIVFAPLMKLLSLQTEAPANNVKVDVSYTQHLTYGQMHYASFLAINGQNGSENMRLNMNLSRMDSSAVSSFPFKIPSGYSAKE